MTVKTKIFRFRVSNYALINNSNLSKVIIQKELEEIDSQEKIEKTLNEFLVDKNFISLQTTPIDVMYHNNGRSNTIDLIYTIVYTDK